MKTMAYIQETGKNFFKCGVAGWCLEVIFTSVESLALHDWRLMGRTSLLMFPIYGMGALLAPIGRGVDRWLCTDPAERLRPADRILRHGMLYMVLIFAVEYFAGYCLRNCGICPWDYTGRHSNINGLIRLDFAPLWFGAGLLFEALSGREKKIPAR